jgi:E3 ubiquitin-protein ligase RNF5
MTNPDLEERASTSTAGSSGDVETEPELRKREPEGNKPKVEDSDNESSEDAKTFECNICLDVAKDAVVSHCGHLFCWPCLHQWLETRPTRQSCPVCKAAISRDKVIPLYGRGGSGKDPRSKIPPRPTPTRQEQPDNNRFTWGGNDGGAGSFHLSFGIGAFPFGFFASAFNWGQPGQAGMNNFNVQFEEQEFLSKIFLWVAIVFIVWLLLA